MAAFATPARLATYMQRDLSAADTATAELLLDQASAAIRNYTRQTLSLATTTAKLTVSARDGLVLPERPVVSVASVLVDGMVLASTAYTLANGTLWGLNGWGLASTVVTVTYTHGLDPIPDDIRDVCLAVAHRRMMNPDGATQVQVNMGPASVTQQFSESVPRLQTVFTDGEKEILNYYRKRYA